MYFMPNNETRFRGVTSIEGRESNGGRGRASSRKMPRALQDLMHHPPKGDVLIRGYQKRTGEPAPITDLGEYRRRNDK